MAENKKPNIDESSFTTFLAEDISFEGEMTVNEPILIKGRVSGTISSENQLYIAEQAELHANIDASLITIQGSVSGRINARDRLELQSSGSIEGEIHASDLVIQSGSRFKGTCNMEKDNA